MGRHTPARPILLFRFLIPLVKLARALWFAWDLRVFRACQQDDREVDGVYITVPLLSPLPTLRLYRLCW